MKSKLLKKVLITATIGLVVGGGIILYIFNMPHRDVQASKVDYEITSSMLVEEYLTDKKTANNKYLQDEGESKILVITGVVSSIEKDMKGQQVILLKSNKDGVGVSCTFTSETNKNTENIIIGNKVSIKGVIRSGAEYDEDFEMYIDAIIEKCDIIK